jgi:hypothetical protein
MNPISYYFALVCINVLNAGNRLSPARVLTIYDAQHSSFFDSYHHEPQDRKSSDLRRHLEHGGPEFVRAPVGNGQHDKAAVRLQCRILHRPSTVDDGIPAADV